MNNKNRFNNLIIGKQKLPYSFVSATKENLVFQLIKEAELLCSVITLALQQKTKFKFTNGKSDKFYESFSQSECHYLFHKRTKENK